MRIAIAGLIFGATVVAAQKPDETRYYNVSGNSAAELRASMNAARPATSDGVRHDGVTTWKIRWRYRTAAARNRCDVTSFDATEEIVETIPKWVNESDASPALVAQWRAFVTALVAHESGHVANAFEALDVIRQAGRGVMSQSNCADLGRLIDQTGNALIAQYKEKDRKYDADTQHGRTQGVRFP
jgi:predicted secreted Zn-dependent protease